MKKKQKENRDDLEEKLIDCCYKIRNTKDFPADLIGQISELVRKHERVTIKLEAHYGSNRHSTE